MLFYFFAVWVFQDCRILFKCVLRSRDLRIIEFCCLGLFLRSKDLRIIEFCYFMFRVLRFRGLRATKFCCFILRVWGLMNIETVIGRS